MLTMQFQPPALQIARPTAHLTEHPRWEQQILIQVATELREFLVPRWIAWGQRNVKPVDASGQGMCRFTSAFLALALPSAMARASGAPFDFAAGWRMQGGFADRFDHQEMAWRYGELEEGYLAQDGRWKSHHWVSDGRWIVDLTASQFGDDPVIVTSVRDPRFRGTLSPAERKTALRDVNDRAQVWLREWLQATEQSSEVDFKRDNAALLRPRMAL